MSDKCKVGRVKVKPCASIGLVLLKIIKGMLGLMTHPKEKLLSTVHMHCGGIWDLTQVYLEQKMAVEALLNP